MEAIIIKLNRTLVGKASPIKKGPTESEGQFRFRIKLIAILKDYNLEQYSSQVVAKMITNKLFLHVQYPDQIKAYLDVLKSDILSKTS